LLVDADVVKPSVSNLLGIHREPGLVDYLLAKNADLSEVLVRTNIPNLSILPAGRSHPHATELLASDNMKSLARELATRYPDRIVLFDSPPLLATSEASILAGLAGQLVMVVDVAKTLQSKVLDALARLDEPSRVGFVMNKVSGGVASNYGYYDYYGS
jgi:capsular exopolysaccharide synthesis family protein